MQLSLVVVTCTSLSSSREGINLHPRFVVVSRIFFREDKLLSSREDNNLPFRMFRKFKPTIRSSLFEKRKEVA